ncbi:YCF48-related protein [Bacteroidota bacterium]
MQLCSSILLINKYFINISRVFVFILVFNGLALSQPGLDFDLFDIQFINESYGWVVGENGKVARTTDGGTTWNKTHIQITNDINSVFFIDSITGWLCGKYGIIFKSDDGGENWIEQVSNTEYDIYSISFFDSLRGWASGPKLLKTIDGGENWMNTPSPPTGYYKSMFWLDTNIGWVVGEYIYKTTNGGNSWFDQTPPGNLNDIFFADDQIGWTVGTWGTILKTTDGGTNWSLQTAPVFQYADAYFVSAEVGWVVGYGAHRIMKTTNGGIYWFLQSGYSYHYFYSVHFLDEYIGWVCGENGIIRKTTNGGSTWGTLFIPVEFVSLNAESFAGKVKLNWTTATELNNLGFEIERCGNRQNWRTIRFVEGKGTTTEIQEYFYTDDLFGVIDSKLYYRLKQIDFNGEFSYSSEVEVFITPSSCNINQNYPNPFNPSTNLKYSVGSLQYVTLKVFDVLGNEIATLVNEEKPAGRYQIEFDATSLPSGIYFYRLQAGTFVETKKMVLLR